MKRILIILLVFASGLSGSNRKYANYNQLVEGVWEFDHPQLELKVTEKEKEIEFKKNGEFDSEMLAEISHWAIDWNYNLYLFSKGKLFMQFKYDYEKKCYVQSRYVEEHPLIIRQKSPEPNQAR